MLPDVRRWRHTNSHNCAEFSAPALLEAKLGERISVVLPALNEEATVGAIVSRLRAALIEDVPLVDELIVMDNGSTDRTARFAADAGATVIPSDEVLAGHEGHGGKGEVLWKSLFVTDGDILAFIDADLIEFDPAFVTGLLGPLLTDPAISFVKGSYDRPLNTSDGIVPTGGGRVTELLARPLLNALWPELAGFVQPLGGEYAGRREVLQSVPFSSGYGVEIGLLIDLLDLVGIDALAEVDLGVRQHRNHGDPELGRMSGQVLDAALRRIRPGQRLSGTLSQFIRTEAGHEHVDWDVATTDHPAMDTVPEYARLRAAQAR